MHASKKLFFKPLVAELQVNPDILNHIFHPINYKSMKINHYLYNAFTIENGKTKIAIDPGSYMKLFNMHSLIPKSEWGSFSHVLITHADPDHYTNVDKIAMASDAPVICGKELLKTENGNQFIIHPRRGGINKWIPFNNAIPLNVGNEVKIGGVTIEGIKTQHGPIILPLFGMKKRKVPGPKERVGLGAIGFKIKIQDKILINLGDTLFQNEWKGLKPDVLMLPIGGLGNNTWTLDVTDAIKTVKLMSPKIVIPCHYNVPFLLKKNAAPANESLFKSEV